jgi:hypothetical protein
LSAVTTILLRLTVSRLDTHEEHRGGHRGDGSVVIISAPSG